MRFLRSKTHNTAFCHVRSEWKTSAHTSARFLSRWWTQWPPRDANSAKHEMSQTSSSMRWMARLAFRAVSSGTLTRGASVSSEVRMLSRVIVFMNSQTALGLTG